MTERPYFVILGAMRTGSNLLERTLDGLDDTACYGEAFNPGFIGGPRKSTLPEWSVAQRDADPLACLAALRQAAPGRIAGFRLFDGHSSMALERVLSDPMCRRIVLRRDPVESYVSLKIARQTDQWMLRNPKRRRTARIRFDPAEFDAYRTGLLAHYEGLYDAMFRNGVSALHLDYDDLAHDTVLQATARYVGSQGALSERAPIIRQNPGPLSDKVENHAEMCAHLGLPVVPVLRSGGKPPLRAAG